MRYYFLSIFILFLFLISCRYTNTPEEFLYQNKVPYDQYVKDKKNIERIVHEHVKSPNSVLVKEKKGLKYLETKIDTIFYGPNNKIVILCMNKRWQINLDFDIDEFPNQEAYYGSSLLLRRIGEDEFEVLNHIGTKFTTNSYKKLSKYLRKIFFNELKADRRYVRYNINDVRFWDSADWVYPDGRRIINE